MRRALIGLAASLLALGVVAGGLAWLLNPSQPPPRASRAERLYYGFCAECHGADGRGSWRAALFLLRAGDLADRSHMAAQSDRYLFDLIKHGGASIGRPGMPAFGTQLSDADIQALVAYVRQLSGTPSAAAGRVAR